MRPSVWRVKAVGRVTLIDMHLFGSCGGEFGFASAVELAEVSVEVGKARADGAGVCMVVASARASVVLRPLPVMQMTVVSSGVMRPWAIEAAR